MWWSVIESQEGEVSNRFELRAKIISEMGTTPFH